MFRGRALYIFRRSCVRTDNKPTTSRPAPAQAFHVRNAESVPADPFAGALDIREIEYYKYNNIYVLVDNDDKDIINYLNSVTNYFIVISNKVMLKDKYISMEDKNKALKVMLKLLKNNNV